MIIMDAETLRIINSLEVETFYLYDLYYDDNEEPLRLTSLPDNFVFQGKTYIPFAITQSEIETNSNGQINDVTISVGNRGGYLQYYIENYELSGRKLSIRQLFRDAQSYMQYDFVIKNIPAATSKQVNLVCGNGFDIFLQAVPTRIVNRDFCRWQFKGAECAYSGPDMTCSKQFQDCKRKGNLNSFGGFPAVVTNRVFA